MKRGGGEHEMGIRKDPEEGKSGPFWDKRALK